jgi:hypothetical protein
MNEHMKTKAAKQAASESQLVGRRDRQGEKAKKRNVTTPDV